MKIYKIAKYRSEAEWKKRRLAKETVYKYFEDKGFMPNTVGGQKNYVEKMDEAMGTCWIQIVEPKDNHPESFYVEVYYEDEYYQDKWGRSQDVPMNWDNPQETIANIERVIESWKKSAGDKMKIYKIAQIENQDAFQSEGHDPMENTEERDRFEEEQNLKDSELGQKGDNHTAEVLKTISTSLPEKITSWYVASGAVGWFRFTDGKIYEVVVSPAAYGHHFDIFRKEYLLQETPEEIAEREQAREEREEMENLR